MQLEPNKNVPQRKNWLSMFCVKKNFTCCRCFYVFCWRLNATVLLMLLEKIFDKMLENFQVLKRFLRFWGSKTFYNERHFLDARDKLPLYIVFITTRNKKCDKTRDQYKLLLKSGL